MADIFISYARSKEGQAKQIAEALRALGYGVWLDDELPAHRSYSEVIEERLKAAKAVIAIWSAEAVKSQLGSGGGQPQLWRPGPWSNSASTASCRRCRSARSSART